MRNVEQREMIEKCWEGRIIYQSRNLIFLKAKGYAARPAKKTRGNAAPAIRSSTEITRSLNKCSV